MVSNKYKKFLNKSFYLKLENKHKMYCETYGNEKGNVFIYLHGGPGYNFTHSILDNFDLKKDYIILYDQRGCGKSKPLGELKSNNIQNLSSDITLLIEKLNIRKKVNLYGGSWGTTLALYYALNNPDRISNLILRGVFLGRKKDIDAIYYPNKKWTDNQKFKTKIRRVLQVVGHV